jgi:CheY-like chemotaxis protein
MTESRKVLLVGDDQVVRKTLEQIFAAEKYAVDAVASGEDAVWKFADDEYDAVLTELDLRGMSGLEVAEEIRGRQPLLPVVILSATDSESDRKRAAAAGVTEFWSKSQPQKQLMAAVNRVLQVAEAAAAKRPAKLKKAQTATIFLERIRNILLFLFAPFFALGYIITFPLFGLGALGWFALKAARRGPEAKLRPVEATKAAPAAAPPAQGIFKTIGMLIAVILISLTYGVIGPVFGFILVVWFAFEAWGRLGAKAIKAGEA